LSQININDDVVDVIDKEKRNNKELQTQCMINHLLFNEFKEFLNKKFKHDDEMISKNLQKELDYIFFLGLQQYKISHTTSSTSLLYNGKKPRRDVLTNLKKLSEFLYDYEKFPHFRKHDLFSIINDAFGQIDSRTKTKYLNCIIANSLKNNSNGTFNVQTFTKQLD